MTKRVSNDTVAIRSRQSQSRPSHKELSGKLREARSIFASKGYLPADPSKLAVDFRSLSLITEDEQHEALQAAFLEISAENYAGHRPPAKSYEPATIGEELFAFSWVSNFFNRVMYFKFCLLKTEDEPQETILYIFSLHLDRGKRKR